MSSQIHPNAQVDIRAQVGSSVTVWSSAVIREDACIGDHTVIGIGVYLGPGVALGSNCRIQNGAQIFEPASLASNCFVGPGAILTNDRHPRAVNSDMSRRTGGDWSPQGVRLDEGVSLGARVVCVGPIRIGSWAMIGAGAVITKDVPAFALVAGNPARRIGWVGHAGYRLSRVDGEDFHCPVTGRTYRFDSAGNLRPTFDTSGSDK